MSNLKRWVRDLLGFSSTETNAFIVLLPLMAIIIFAQPTYHRFFSKPKDELNRNEAKLDSIIGQSKSNESLPRDSASSEMPTNKIFPFDPNSATETELNSLGFSPILSKRIISYRSKGGTFKIKSHLLKIYGMDTALYRQLYHAINLPEKIQTDQSPQVNAAPEKIIFNLNEADTATLEKINGIGPVLAKRIVKYRNILGGFIKPEQLKEIYGLDSIVADRVIKASFVSGDVKQININGASESELDVHPYINKAMAKAIVTYRFQHGKFKSVDEIRNIVLLSPVTDKVIPYLKID
jgi:competence protein ComEA